MTPCQIEFSINMTLREKWQQNFSSRLHHLRGATPQALQRIFKSNSLWMISFNELALSGPSESSHFRCITFKFISGGAQITVISACLPSSDALAEKSPAPILDGNATAKAALLAVAPGSTHPDDK